HHRPDEGHADGVAERGLRRRSLADRRVRDHRAARGEEEELYARRRAGGHGGLLTTARGEDGIRRRFPPAYRQRYARSTAVPEACSLPGPTLRRRLRESGGRRLETLRRHRARDDCDPRPIHDGGESCEVERRTHPMIRWALSTNRCSTTTSTRSDS